LRIRYLVLLFFLLCGTRPFHLRILDRVSVKCSGYLGLFRADRDSFFSEFFFPRLPSQSVSIHQCHTMRSTADRVTYSTVVQYLSTEYILFYDCTFFGDLFYGTVPVPVLDLYSLRYSLRLHVAPVDPESSVPRLKRLLVIYGHEDGHSSHCIWHVHMDTSTRQKVVP
jgi:hypothetical protein